MCHTSKKKKHTLALLVDENGVALGGQNYRPGYALNYVGHNQAITIQAIAIWAITIQAIAIWAITI